MHKQFATKCRSFVSVIECTNICRVVCICASKALSSSWIHIILTTEDYHSQAGIYDLDISRQQRKCNVSSILLCSSCSETQCSCWGVTRSDIAAPHNWWRLHIWWNREWMNEPPDKSALILTIVRTREAILYRLLMGIFFHSSISCLHIRWLETTMTLSQFSTACHYDFILQDFIFRSDPNKTKPRHTYTSSTWAWS